ncbi:MAG: AAA family ATPase [Thermoplasmatales archaeon]
MICVTGTPGTGKSTLMEKMKRKGLDAHEFDEIIGQCISSQDGDEAIVDEKCLRKIKETGIYFGHLSHYAQCDLVIVLRAHLSNIESRLAERGYSRSKIMDNIECEAIDLIGEEAFSIHPASTHEIINENIDETFELIEKIIRGEASKKEKIDLTEEILDWY